MKAVFLILLLAVSTSLLAASPKRVLMVVTSYDGLVNGNKTGYWGEELAIPYRIFEKAGFEVIVASPRGGNPPLDEASVKTPDKALNEQVLAFLKATAKKLKRSPKLSQIDGNTLEAVFVVGGHGVLWDLTNDAHLATIAARLYAKKKVVAAVCHGPAALVSLKRENSSDPLLKGHAVTGFSNDEENAVGLSQVVKSSPLKDLLQVRLAEASGNRYAAALPWTSNVVVSGNVITGQNPASSAAVARAVVETIAAK